MTRLTPIGKFAFLLIISGVAAVTGLAMSLVSSLAYIGGFVPPCGTGACEAVAFHGSAFIFGFPVAYLAVFHFGLQLLIVISILFSHRTKFLMWLGFVNSVCAGVFASYLLYNMVVVIRETCSRCLVSDVCIAINILLFASLTTVDKKPFVSIKHKAVACALWSLCFGVAGVYFLRAVSFEREMMRYAIRGISLNLGKTSKFELMNGRLFGSGNASSTAVEFIDPLCSACHYHLKRLLDRQRVGGRFDLVVRFFPLGSNPFSHQASVLVAAALDDGEFLRRLEAFSTAKPTTPQMFKQVSAAFRSSVSELKRGADVVERDHRLGLTLGVEGTPTFITIDKSGAISGVGVIPFQFGS